MNNEQKFKELKEKYLLVCQNLGLNADDETHKIFEDLKKELSQLQESIRKGCGKEVDKITCKFPRVFYCGEIGFLKGLIFCPSYKKLNEEIEELLK